MTPVLWLPRDGGGWRASADGYRVQIYPVKTGWNASVTFTADGATETSHYQDANDAMTMITVQLVGLGLAAAA